MSSVSSFEEQGSNECSGNSGPLRIPEMLSPRTLEARGWCVCRSLGSLSRSEADEKASVSIASDELLVEDNGEEPRRKSLRYDTMELPRRSAGAWLIVM